MAWEAIAGGAIAGAGALLGGHQKSDANWRNEALQREFAQHGIQWRVEDAIRAGLHPLYALGGAGAAYSPGPIKVGEPGLAAAGQEISRAMLASAGADVAKEQADLARRMGDAQIMKDEAQAMYYYSLAGRTSQQAVPGVSSDPSVYANPNVVVNPAFDARTAADLVQVKPMEVYSYNKADRSVGAGRHHTWSPFVYKVEGGKERVIYLPSQKGSIEEALESVAENYGLMITVLNENIRRNPNFLDEARGTIPFAGSAYDASEFVWGLRNAIQQYRSRSGRRYDVPNPVEGVRPRSDLR